MMDQDKGEMGGGQCSFSDTNPEAWQRMREMANGFEEIWVKRRNGKWLKGHICGMEQDGIRVVYHDPGEPEGRRDITKTVNPAELWQWQSEAPGTKEE